MWGRVGGGSGSSRGVHTPQGHALWATATRSKFPPSLPGEACLSPPTRCRPNHRARSQPGRSTASRPGPPRPPRSALRPWPSEAVARAWQPLRSALGPRAAPAAGTPSLARRDSLCLPSPGVQRPVRAAPRRTEERGRGKAGAGGRGRVGVQVERPRRALMRTMQKPRAAGAKPEPPLQPYRQAWVCDPLGLGTALKQMDPGRLSGPRAGGTALLPSLRPLRSAARVRPGGEARPGLAGPVAALGMRGTTVGSESGCRPRSESALGRCLRSTPSPCMASILDC